MWTQVKVQNLKEGWRTTRRVLISGIARLVLWDNARIVVSDCDNKNISSRRVGTVI